MNIEDAINFELEGLSSMLTPVQLREFKGLRQVKKKVELVRDGKISRAYYINLLPVASVADILVGRRFVNSRGCDCTIMEVDRVMDPYTNHTKTLITVSSGDKHWKMYLNTLLGEERVIVGLPKEYTATVNKVNYDYYLDKLEKKLNKYMDIYNNLKSNQVETINNRVKLYDNTSVVTREAIKRAKSDIRKDATYICDAWNSTLTQEERDTLLNWIKKHVYSMRLWVLKDGSYDKAITELFPDEIYGKKRRGEASELSKDHICGYISFNTNKGAPLDIIAKITKKVDKNASLIKNKGSNKYRLNNYMLVLYLLQNYNDIGFVTGKTKLSQYIKK